MLFSKAEDLEDRIIRFVLGGRISIKSLHAELLTQKMLSSRAVYKAVDKLIEAGVLLKVGTRVLVNEEWVRGVGEQLKTSSLAVPSAGERLSYTFTSTKHLDAFWKTVVLPMEEAAESKEVFFYNPHDFWAYIPERQESESAYYKHFGPKQQGFFTIGGETEADREFKREYQSEYLQIDMRDIAALRRSDHLTVIGPLIITVRLSRKTTVRIDELYAKGQTIKDMLPELLTISRAPGSIRFILENDSLKAKKLRKLLARNFYFPQVA